MADPNEKSALLPGNDTFVQCTHGPYRDRRIQMTNAEADEAESDGWGYRIPGNISEMPVPPELTPEENYEVAVKAYGAAVDLRNEEEFESGPSPTRRSQKEKKKQLEAEDSAKYQTRDMKSKK